MIISYTVAAQDQRPQSCLIDFILSNVFSTDLGSFSYPQYIPTKLIGKVILQIQQSQ